MAEGNEDRNSEDLSEEISQARLEEFRRKGQVFQSRELTSLVGLVAAAVTIYVMMPSMAEHMKEFMREVFRTDLSARADLGNLSIVAEYMKKAGKLFLFLGLPAGLVAMVLGMLTSFAQVGALFTFEPLMPDMSKIDPLSGTKRMFSLQHLTEMLRLAIKITIVSLLSYTMVKTEILGSARFLFTGQEGLTEGMANSARVIFMTLCGVLLIFAGADFFLQRFNYNKQLRLTKEEAKQEHKEREGDPQIKARIRAVQREMSRKRMMQAVRKADVIVTNPTHIAIAIVYEKDKMAAPKVVAKGADFLAQKIKKIAAEAGVPTVENVPLARALYKSVKVGQFVPRTLYQAVAEVLAFVYRLKNHRL